MPEPNVKLLGRRDVEKAYHKGIWPEFDHFRLEAKAEEATGEVYFILSGQRPNEEIFLPITTVYSKKHLKIMTGTN